MEQLLSLADVHVHFFTREGVAKVLRGIDLTIEEGETLGVVGESGSGKSVLSNAIVNLVRKPGRIMKGRICFQNENLLEKSEKEMQSIRGKSINLIIPNPKSALNPIESIGKQMTKIYRSHFKVSGKEARDHVINALKEVGINDPEERFSAYPHELSGGMAKRVIIATALMTSPRLLIADEPTFGLDVTIQRQVLEKFGALIKSNKMTTMIFTRDLSLIAHYCQRVAIIHSGKLIEIAPVERFFTHAHHPYSIFLIGSTQVDSEKRRYSGKFMDTQTKYIQPQGCIFAGQCKFVMPVCENTIPELEEIGIRHQVACFHGRREQACPS